MENVPQNSAWQIAVELEDVFPLILSKLDFVSRVRDTVLVCRRWASICLSNPPQDTALRIALEGADASYLRWITQCCRPVESAEVHCSLRTMGLPASALAQSLAIVASCCPVLREPSICFRGYSPVDYGRFTLKRQGYDWDHFADCLPLFWRLETLVLENTTFVTCPYSHEEYSNSEDEEDTVPQYYFKGLKLKALVLSAAEEHYQRRPIYTKSLTTALNALSRTLTRLEVNLDLHAASFDFDFEEAAPRAPDLAESICQLTALRSLQLHTNAFFCIKPAISDLASLTFLGLSSFIDNHEHIAALSSLQELQIYFYGTRDPPELIPSPLITPSLTGLTRLHLGAADTFFKQTDLPALLPEACLTEMANLVHLKLEMGSTFTDLQPSLARSLSSVTHLDLSGCGFTQLPPTLGEMRGLRVLNVSRSKPLQLSIPCLNVLRLLPNLRHLVLMDHLSHKPVWTTDALGLMYMLPSQFPGLFVQIR